FKKHYKKDPDDEEKLKEYTAWSYLDFKNTDERGNFVMSKNFNYDLDKKLEEYPIKNLQYQDSKNRIKDMMMKGNRAYASVETSQGDKEVFVEAVPKFNSLNLYDEQKKQIRLTPGKKEETQSASQEQTAGNK